QIKIVAISNNAAAVVPGHHCGRGLLPLLRPLEVPLDLRAAPRALAWLVRLHRLRLGERHVKLVSSPGRLPRPGPPQIRTWRLPPSGSSADVTGGPHYGSPPYRHRDAGCG